MYGHTCWSPHSSECPGLSEEHAGGLSLSPSTHNFEAEFRLNTELSVSQLASHSNPPASGFDGDEAEGVCGITPLFLHGCWDLNSGLQDSSANTLNC